MFIDPTTITIADPFHDQIIDYQVTDKEIILIVKRHYMSSNSLGMKTEAIKLIYSRFDGSAKEIIGEILPPQDEQIRFD